MDVLDKIERTCKKVMNVYICDKYKDEWLVCVHEALIDAKCEIIANREKDDKHRWHDLRKNPEDLPDEGRIIVATDGESLFCGETVMRCAGVVLSMKMYRKNDYCPCTEEYIANSDLIAWRYIEPFEEAE